MAETQEIRYAGFWVRVGATALDLLVFTLISVPLLYAIHGRGYFQSEVPARGLVDFLNMFVLPNLIVPLLWVLCGATPGKMAVSAKIVDARTGKKPTLRQCLLRFVGCYLSLLLLGLGFFWIAVDRKKQGWHDKLAGTVVVRTR
jgi:uncharacterized RDD family membrane protein YckC